MEDGDGVRAAGGGLDGGGMERGKGKKKSPACSSGGGRGGAETDRGRAPLELRSVNFLAAPCHRPELSLV
jgi:hypothetical protein